MIAGMPDRSDDIDFDEGDIRQPVVDQDANMELSQLRSSVENIERELTELASEKGRSLDAIGHMLNDRLNDIRSIASALLVVAAAGIIVIVGTLRHWF